MIEQIKDEVMTMTQSGLTLEKRDDRTRQESTDELLQSLAEILDDLDKQSACIVLGRMKRLASSIRNSSNTVEGVGLSQREIQVLVLIAHGYTRRDIAESLGISSNTAARHIANIYSKLGISSVAEATTFALEHNLIALAVGQ